MSRVVKLAIIPGDGIGPEVIAEADKVLDVATSRSDVSFDKTYFSLGADRFIRTGDVLTDDDLAALAAHDAILLGGVGGTPNDPRLANANIERGLLLKLRFTLDHYVNLRPSKLFPTVSGPLSNPGEIDFVVVREGTEGAYVGNGGVLRQGTEHEIANELGVNTAHGVRRVVEYAFDLAAKRRGKLTLVHKTNVMVNAGKLWKRITDEVGAEHPDVAVDYMHIDAATIHMVDNPSRFDVIVTDNLFGDILTDLAGAITGGIGLAASGNLNPSGAFPSMFEPVHGSAPDIAGTQKADPTAAIGSVALLLDHLGLTAESARVTRAIEADLAARTSEDRTTAQVGHAIAARLAD